MHGNFAIITDQLSVSDAPTDEDLREVAAGSYSAVIDLRSEGCDDMGLLEKLGLAFLHIEIDDTYTPTTEQLDEIFAFADYFLNRGKRILVHCRNGCGRSPLIVAAILIHRGTPTQAVLDLLYDRQPLIGLSDRQKIFIHGLEEKLKKIERHGR